MGITVCTLGVVFTVVVVIPIVCYFGIDVVSLGRVCNKGF